MLESLFYSEYCEIFQSTYFEEHLRTAASENIHETEKNFRLSIRDLNSALKKEIFSTSVSKTSENVCLCFYFMIGVLGSLYLYTIIL